MTRRGTVAALAAALLFGAAAPLLKPLTDRLPPLLITGLLYSGAALGTAPLVWRASGGALNALDARRLAAAVLSGGILAPLALILALRLSSAAAVSILLGLEAPATATLGALLFRDPLGRSGWLGIGVAVLASLLLAAGGGVPGVIAALLVIAGCFLWALDNHLTSLIDTVPPARTTFVKGLAAGTANLTAAAVLSPAVPAPLDAVWVLAVGAICYGVSIALYIAAAQRLGAVRSQAAFATAPFWGVALAVLFLGEPLSARLLVAMALAAAAVSLIARDRHEHRHRHEAVEHAHRHRHDDGHHGHRHPGLAVSTEHWHQHAHDACEHTHAHVPDLHHRHSH